MRRATLFLLALGMSLAVFVSPAMAGTFSFSGPTVVTEPATGTTTADYTATCNDLLTGGCSGQFVTSNGTATAGADYQSVNIGVSAPASLFPTVRTISVPILSDGRDENDETFTASLSNSTGGPITTTITDVDAPPSVAIHNAANVTEGGTLQFQVTLSTASGKNVSVNYATASGTATSGSDFPSTSGTVTFAPGETTKTILVPTTQDTLDENNESLTVVLSTPVNVTLGPAIGTGTIVDDDPPPVASIAAAMATEGSSIQFPVTLSTASGKSVSVKYATIAGAGTATEGTDYPATTGTLVIPAGSTTGTISVPTTQDTLDENDEQLAIGIQAIDDTVTVDPSRSIAAGTINDDDAAPTVSFDPNIVTVNEGGVATLTVRLSAASGRTASINYSTVNATAVAPDDYTSASGTLTFAPGETSKTIQVTTAEDNIYEPGSDSEGFIVALSGEVNLTVPDDNRNAVVFITDNDAQPSVSIADASVSEAAGPANVAVTLSNPSTQDITVQYATSNDTAVAGTDYTATSGTLTFPAGSTARTISVPITNNDFDQDSRAFKLTLSSPGNATIARSVGSVTITDDDATPVLSLSAPVAVTEGNSGTTTASLSVTITGRSSRPITVQYATVDNTAVAPSDYVAVPATTLTFPAFSTAAQPVNFTVNGDTTIEPDENFGVLIGSPTNATIGTSASAITIVNDDAAANPTTGGTTGTTPTTGGTTGTAPTTGGTTGTSPTTGGTTGTTGTTAPKDTTPPSVKLAAVSFKKSKHRISTTLSCPGETLCRGTLNILTVPSKKSKYKDLRKEIKLGSLVFLIPQGKSATLTARLSSKVQSLLKKSGSIAVKAYVVAYDKAGNSKATTSTGKLKR